MLIPFGAPHIFETIKATTNLKGTFSKECRGINCIQIWLEIKKTTKKQVINLGVGPFWLHLTPYISETIGQYALNIQKGNFIINQNKTFDQILT